MEFEDADKIVGLERMGEVGLGEEGVYRTSEWLVWEAEKNIVMVVELGIGLVERLNVLAGKASLLFQISRTITGFLPFFGVCWRPGSDLSHW